MDRVLRTAITLKSNQTALYWSDPKTGEQQSKTMNVESDDYGLLILNTFRRYSKIQNKTIFVKRLLEYRLFLHAIGIFDFSKGTTFINSNT